MLRIPPFILAFVFFVLVYVLVALVGVALVGRSVFINWCSVFRVFHFSLERV